MLLYVELETFTSRPTGDGRLDIYFIDVEGKPTRDRDRMAADRGGLKRFVLRVVDSAQPGEKLVEALR